MRSGGPSPTRYPPRSPPSGPKSMTQSAVLITSRLCSMRRIEPPAFALFTDQLDVCQKLHFNHNRAIALAGLAASTRYVEGEVPGSKSALMSFRRSGKQFADSVKSLDVGHRIRAGRTANRGLI